ncbi:MAG: hypothetical protein IPN76_13750 [Saprospiraceae bacterium]|nr:hypothetical protein [Saprospiraceae bacterium]
MNLSLLRVSVLMIFFANNACAQNCLVDLYGNWKSKNGNFINLMGDVYDYPRIKESSIGNDSLSLIGHFSYSKFVLRIDVDVAYDKQIGKFISFEKVFEFSVIDVDFQILKLKPISIDAKKMFGEHVVIFFNENFVDFESFHLDSLRYTYLHAPFVLEINQKGEMKKEIDFYKSNYWRWYSRKLSEQEQMDLRKMIFHSQIITMSKCGLLWRTCADCRPARILIINNEHTTNYYGDGIDENITPLLIYLNNLVVKSKWKRIKKIKNRKK